MLLANLHKELLLLRSDLHGLAVLLVMPVCFMFILSFALSADRLPEVSLQQIYIQDNANSTGSKLLKSYLNTGSKLDAKGGSLVIAQDFEQLLWQAKAVTPALQLTFSDTLAVDKQHTINSLVSMALAKVRLHAFLLDSGDIDASSSLEQQRSIVDKYTDNSKLLTSKTKSGNNQVSGVMQSVPAWLVFGLFFIVLPISNALLLELSSGTLLRLKTFPISANKILLAKALSFWIINLLQASILLVVGIWLLPAVLDQELLLQTPLWLFAVLTLATSLSSVGFGLVIAILIKTSEQAIVWGGGAIILLSAVSGIMVPVTMMPDWMQDLASTSPMYWAANGFKQLLLAPSQWSDIAGSVLALTILGLILLSLALLLFNRKMRNILWS